MPQNVKVNEDTSGGEGRSKPELFCTTYESKPNLVKAHTDAYQTGSEARKELAVGGSAKGRYEVVSGDASIDVAIQRMFQDNRQYAMFSYNDRKLFANFGDYGNEVNEDLLYEKLSRAYPWEPTNIESIRRWRTVFSSLGTHVIIGVEYGSRLSLVSLPMIFERFEYYLNARSLHPRPFGQQTMRE